jgi:SAM-dependent methyltransferase
MSNMPERIEWAVSLLDIGADDQIVEIGGGNGVAAQLVLRGLGPNGRLLFIDRSPIAIARATARNGDDPRFVAAEGDFPDSQLQAESIDTIFAVNVNVFWTGDAVVELEAIRGALRPEGELVLVYDAPSRERLDEIGNRVKTSLTRAGLIADVKVREDGPLLAVVARRI